MRKLRILGRWLAGALVIGAVTLALASGEKANDILKSINDYRAQLVKDAQASGKAPNYQAITESVKTKALDAIKDVDPKKVDAKEAYAWGQLFQAAGKSSEARDLYRTYSGAVTGEERAKAATMIVATSYSLNDPAGVVEGLNAFEATDAQTASSLLSLSSAYAGYAAEKVGAEGAIRLIDRGLQAVEKFPAQDEAAKKLAPALRDRAQTAKIELLVDAGRKADALKLIDEAIATSPNEAAKKSLGLRRTQLTIVGTAAPSLAVERSQGAFAGLGDYKGKVVLIDFFAHWCPPCKASYPDMRKMYDELHAKGLEIVGVTTYYGYYNAENREKRDMPKDTEFGKMADFIKEFNIAWPVAYGDRSNFEAYGVTGIPHVAVIDRHGVVRKIEIGYSPATFSKFRAEVEAILAEK